MDTSNKVSWRCYWYLIIIKKRTLGGANYGEKAQGLKRAGCIEEIGPNSIWLEHEMSEQKVKRRGGFRKVI